MHCLCYASGGGEYVSRWAKGSPRLGDLVLRILEDRQATHAISSVSLALPRVQVFKRLIESSPALSSLAPSLTSKIAAIFTIT